LAQFKPKLKITDFRKASSARLTDEIYKITPNGAGLVTGKRVGADGG
jgi:hypothetical protein